jgi:redox-sensing transcriptional repressor
MIESRVGKERGEIRRAPHGWLLRRGRGGEKQQKQESFRGHWGDISMWFCYNRRGLVKPTNKVIARTPKAKQSLDQVSELTTNRLSVYLRCLTLLEGAGVRGVGYYVRDLKRHLRQILGLDRKRRVAIIGAGNLRLALADYPGFRLEGFEISALFDNLSAKVGQQSRGGVPIHDIHELKKFMRRDSISIAVIAVPAESAQRVLDLVVASGIKAVLNFSPGTLQVPAGVKLKSVDLTVSLESLSFYLARGETAEE